MLNCLESINSSCDFKFKFYIYPMIKKFCLVLILIIGTSHSAFSAGSEGGGDNNNDGGNEGQISKYTKGHRLVMSGKYLEKKADKLQKKGKIKKAEKSLTKAKKKYEKAFKLLIESNKEKPNTPDTLNYLGFTSRKLGNFDDAEKYYLSGLKIKPDHNGINEYLGELYIQTNRLDLAKGRLEVLKNCKCEEYEELKELIENN